MSDNLLQSLNRLNPRIVGQLYSLAHMTKQAQQLKADKFELTQKILEKISSKDLKYYRQKISEEMK